MRSTFHALEIARRGLTSHQAAISTTGHNLVNAGTEGYSRQRVNLAAARAVEVPAMNRSVTPGQLGTGVGFDSIKRLREGFLDSQFRHEAQSLGSWNIQKDTLEKIEILFNEQTENGLSTVIDQFWNSWQVLSAKQDDLTARHVLKENTIAMLDAFKHVDTKLSELHADLNDNIAIKMAEANTYIEQIAQLNIEINRIENVGNNANDLRDKRDLLADKLANLVQVQVTEQPNGMYLVTLPAGAELVNGGAVALFGDGVDVNQVTGGELRGLIDSRDEIVPEYQAHLNTMLKGLVFGEVTVTIPEGSVLPVDLVDEDGTVILPAGTVATEDIPYTVNGINGLHSLGWTLRTTTDAGNNEVPLGNIPFFVPNDADNFSIQDLVLNPDIAADVGKIAASLRLDPVDGSVLKGNGDLALLMGQLRHNSFSFVPEQGAAGEGSFEDYLRSVIGALGVQTKYAQAQVEKQEISINAIDNRRQSVSGVSLDEEMSNLIQFQHAYNASARMMTTVDQVLDRIINNMGIVGR